MLEGKKYATIGIGCTGGRHRSVYLIECLAAHLASRLIAIRAAGESGLDWRQTVTHRELSPGEAGAGGLTTRGQTKETPKDEAMSGLRTESRADGEGQKITPVQAQEA